MNNNTAAEVQLPEDILKQIDSDANDYLGEKEVEFSQRSFNAYIAGATAWAIWKLKYDELILRVDKLLTIERELLKAAEAAHREHAALKERADKMEAALKDIAGGKALPQLIAQQAFAWKGEVDNGELSALSEPWISVDDRLPQSDESNSVYCIVFDVYWGVVVRPYNQAHNCWDGEDGDDYYTDAKGGKITHWMPVPGSPFKGKKEVDNG